MTKRILAIFAAAALAATVGCSSKQPEAAKQDDSAGKKPAAEQKAAEDKPQTESGRIALQRMYASARMWAPDAQPIRLDGNQPDDKHGQDGRVMFWQAYFAAPSIQKQRMMTWSGLAGPDAPERGVSKPGSDNSWSATNASDASFDIQYIKVDTDKAFEVAQAHGGKKVLQKAPDTPVTYNLRWDPRKQQALWHVLYGDRGSKLHIAVDATSGDFVRTVK